MKLVRSLLCASFACVMLVPGIAWADTPSSDDPPKKRFDSVSHAEVDADGQRVRLSVEDLADASDGGNASSRGGTITCTYLEIGEELGYVDPDGVALPGGYQQPGALAEGFYYIANCVTAGTGDRWSRVFQHQPGQPTIAPETLARRAAAELAPAAPTPRFNPAGLQLAGFATWLWIDDHIWEPFGATASIPALTATATATPRSITWDPGDGSDPVVCHGPGIPYDPDIPITHQDTDCRHVYQYFGRYDGTVTIAWDVEWATTGGQSGTFAWLETTTDFEIGVGERQAVGLPG